MRKAINKSITIDEKTGCGTLHVIVEYDTTNIISLRCHLGKQGTCTKVFMDSLTLLATEALRSGVSLDTIIMSINNHHCSRSFVKGKETTWSCADALAKALKQFKKFIESGERS